MKQSLFLILMFFLSLSVFTQTRTIRGTISSSQGILSGASILIKGSSTGTNTDNLGQYSISAQRGDVLVISSVGHEPQEVTVDNSNNIINVSLVESGGQLSEVVVTALGINRQKKSLTYSVQTVDNSDLNTAKRCQSCK